MSKHTITREQIAQHGGLGEVLSAFDDAYPSGVAEYDPTSAEDAARILGGPLAEWWAWNVDNGIAVPFFISVGDYGTSTAGDYGTSTSGYRGTATAGEEGTSTSGHHGTSVSGNYGTATAGVGGTSTSGHHGTSISGNYGTATAGDEGTIVITHYDGRRHRLVVGYIGETTDAAGEVLAPGVAYRLDEDGRFVRAEADRGVGDE